MLKVKFKILSANSLFPGSNILKFLIIYSIY